MPVPQSWSPSSAQSHYHKSEQATSFGAPNLLCAPRLSMLQTLVNAFPPAVPLVRLPPALPLVLVLPVTFSTIM